MTSILEWLNSSLEKIEHNLFKDVVKVDDAETHPMGDGQIVMISDIKRINLTMSTKSGEKKQLKAIVKLEANSGPGRDLAANCDAFTTEILMYGDVLKSMERLMWEVRDDDYMWAECYHCGENKLLFQDLCEDGFRVVPTYKFLDLDHADLVMSALGKFHGLSMVMKERNTLKNEYFKVPYYARKLPFMDIMQKQSIDILTKTMKEKWGEDWSAVGERLLKYLDKPGEMLYSAWESSNGKWDVLNHGDFTMRNMLFHYKPDSTIPDGIKFVDFQMCHYSNLANDLVTLLYTSLRPPLREENMKLLLDTYINSLTCNTKLYGFKGSLPTVQDVQSSIRSLAPLIVTNTILTIPFFIITGKEDLQKKADEYFEKFDTCNDIANSQDQEIDSNLMGDYDDSDVKEFLQFELRRCLKENIF